MIMKFIHSMSSPQYFYRFASRWLPWAFALTVLLLTTGLVWGLAFAPPDYQQGDGFRVIYLHVPCAIASMAIYGFMASLAFVALIWRIKLCYLLMRVSARIGAWFTFFALATGSLWGKPMWGTYWVWDARLTAELILLFLYLGIIALASAIPQRDRANKATAWFVLIGAIDLPIIHFSVNWWQTLHQGASLSLLSKPTIAPAMLTPLLIMIVGVGCYFVTALLMQGRNEVLKWERRASWVTDLGRLKN